MRAIFQLIVVASLAAAGGGRVVAAQGEPVANGIRIGQPVEGVTRFVIDVSEPIKFQVFLLADPNRAVIDLPQMNWAIDPLTGARARGLISNLRYGQFQSGSRMVLDLSQPAEIASAQLLPSQEKSGSRLIIDLKSTSREQFLEAIEQSRTKDSGNAINKVAFTPPPLAANPPKSKTDGRRVIVIDPGHGGVDPGAISTSGVYEKEITLLFAKELRKKLQSANRYKVSMTRDSDEFIELKHRVEIGRERQADLFISIHADAIENKQIRGGTVYTLSQTASDKEADTLATKENKSDIIAGVDLGKESDQVTSILIDLAQRETMNHSASFAQVLVGELEQKVIMHKNGHRFAGFRVLKAPDIPSVLIELGYLSSKADEDMLRAPAGRGRMIDSIARAVDRYFSAVKG